MQYEPFPKRIKFKHNINIIENNDYCNYDYSNYEDNINMREENYDYNVREDDDYINPYSFDMY